MSETPTSRPTKGLFCPKPEDHLGSRERLLCCFSDDAIFLRCADHDWLRIELYNAGAKVDFSNLAVVFSDTRLPKNSPVHYFNLKPISTLAKGAFPVRKREWRKQRGIKQ